jgi:uncharacterized protein (TIGR02452 family)
MSKALVSCAPPDTLFQGEELNLDELEKYSHNATQWRHWFDYHISNKSKKPLAALRRLVMRQTMTACRSKQYIVVDFNENVITSEQIVHIEEQSLTESAKKTKMYHESDFLNISTRDKLFKKTKLIIMSEDCIEAGLWLKNQLQNSNNSLNDKVAVLNMANPNSPGGGYKSGSGAQEENIHRRTNMYQCLENVDNLDPDRTWKYPLPEFGGVFTPDAVVIRGSEAKGYPWLEKPENLSFISVAAYKNPKWHQKTEDGMKRKMRVILNMALENQCYNIILSAFGCGAYRNPPEKVAKCFKQIIEEFEGMFENIIFAIIDDHNSNKDHNKEGNLAPFAKQFDMQVQLLE